MAVGLQAPAGVLPVAGIRIGTAALGGREKPRDDLTVMEIAPGSNCAAVFTRNALCAAPVLVARQHMGTARPRYLLVNAGNANAGTGGPGFEDAVACCRVVAGSAGCETPEVLPFSTGVIGERLDVARFEAAVPAALAALDADHWAAAAAAIGTTDTVAKATSRRFEIGDRECVVTGIAKGSGMIRPDMATMLAFVATDATLAPGVLQHCMQRAVDESFNCITVDGDTSTNDSCIVVATGASGAPVIDDVDEAGCEIFYEALREVCQWLARAIVRDGEGATKFVTVEVVGGRSGDECRAVAYTIAHSPLVKTALFASDANWGRILAAVGRAGVHDLDIERVRIEVGGVLIAEGGCRAESYREEDGDAAFAGEEILIRVALGRGSRSARVWTCDFSYDYVRINAEYRS